MEDLNWLHQLGLATFFFIAVYFVNCLVFSKRSRQPLPPGPWSLPVIGHLHLLKKPLQRTFWSLSVQYGPVFSLKLGSQYAVVVSSPAAVEECFGKNDVVLADRRPMLSSKHLHYDSTTIGASNYGDHWRNVRRISNQEVFSVSKQTMFLSLRQEEVKSMIKSLFCLTRQGKQKVEMKSRSDELTFNIVVGTVIGKRYCGEGAEDSVEAKEFLDIIHKMVEVSAVSNLGDFIPFFKLIDFESLEKKMVKLKRRVDVVLQKLIDETKSKMKNGGVAQSSMLSNILTLQQTDSDVSLSNTTIKGLMLMLITAGTETTAATIEWAMSLLLNNPEKLKKARSEIDAMISPGRLVQDSELPMLTYIQAIVNETFRMYPAAPILAPHYSSGECTIQGFHVPRGTMIFTNAWAIHRDPEVWEDPLSFKPERFVGIEERSYDYKLVPFGVGRRSCPGASMARKVVGLALASLIQCFDWERIGEEEVDMREGDGISMPKLMPLEAMCQPRNNMLDMLSSL